MRPDGMHPDCGDSENRSHGHAPLHHEKLVDFKNLRGMLVKVSPLLAEWVDG